MLRRSGRLQPAPTRDVTARVAREARPHQRDWCGYSRHRQSRLPDAHRRRRVFGRDEAERLPSGRDRRPGLPTGWFLQANLATKSTKEQKAQNSSPCWILKCSLLKLSSQALFSSSPLKLSSQALLSSSPLKLSSQ